MKVRINCVLRQVSMVALVFLLLAACRQKKDEIVVSPPLTFPLSQSYVGYGVINVSYTRVSASIEESGASVGYLRQGSVVRVIERRLVKEEGKTEAWVLVEGLTEGAAKGWLKESLMDIFDNESQAETAAESMRDRGAGTGD